MRSSEVHQREVQNKLDIDWDVYAPERSTTPASAKSWTWSKSDHDRIRNLHKTIEQNERIRNLLRTRNTINNTPSHLLLSCTHKIIQEIYGGFHQILYFLVNNASNDELNKIYEIIKTENDKLKKKKKNTKDKTEPKYEKECIQSLDCLPSCTISYITAFLNENEIKGFKSTSRRIAIVCMEQMLKFHVSIFNMNELILFDDWKNKTRDYDQYRSYLKCHRYHRNRSMLQLQELWSTYYDIDRKQQLLIPFDVDVDGNMCISKSKLKMFFKTIMHDQTKILYFDRLDFTKYLLFNTKYIVDMEPNCDPQIMSHNDNNIDECNVLNDKCLLILSYFDVMQQTVDYIQFVLIHNDITYNDIIDYIKHKFIIQTAKQSVFYEILNKRMHKMTIESTNEALLSLNHQEYHDHGIEWRMVTKEKMNKSIRSMFYFNTFREVVFQLNPIRCENAQYMEYGRFEDYLHDCVDIQIMSKVKIDSLKHMISSFDDSVIAPYISDFSSEFDGKRFDNIHDRVRMSEIRDTISDAISHRTVDSRYIELFSNDDCRLIPWNDTVEITINYMMEYKIKFELVSYDVSTIDYAIQKVFCVSIYSPEQVPFPFGGNDNGHVDTNVYMVYNKKFVMKDLVQYVMDDVIHRPLYENTLKDIADIYNEHKDNMDFIMQKYHRKNRKIYEEMEQCFETDIKLLTHVTEFQLYMIIKPQNYEHMRMITIRFINWENLTDLSKVFARKYQDIKDHHMFVGLPLKIWLDENKSMILKEIIDSDIHLKVWNEYLHTDIAFTVSNDEVIGIEAQEYVIADNDIILLKMCKHYA